MGWDWGSLLKGVGSLASAWGTYEVGKEQAKIAKETLAYEKSKDALALEKTDAAQAELNSALNNVYGTTKKKKKTTTNALSDAFVDSSLAVV